MRHHIKHQASISAELPKLGAPDLSPEVGHQSLHTGELLVQLWGICPNLRPHLYGGGLCKAYTCHYPFALTLYAPQKNRSSLTMLGLMELCWFYSITV